MPERTLDYLPRLDPRNKSYRVGAPSAALSLQSRFWTPGLVVTDQGSEGACVGHGVVNEALASPVRRNDSGMGRYADVANNVAAAVYREAQKVDEWEGESYEGTSVRAGMLVGRERGWWTGFRWAFSMLELRAALEEGPVVVGVEWKSGMYSTWAYGQVRVAGSFVGGHCLLVTGYSPNWNGWGPHYRWRNSWGPSYGRNGSAYIRAVDLEKILFLAGGEAAVAVDRRLGS